MDLNPFLVGPAGFELATFRLSAERSNHAELWTHFLELRKKVARYKIFALEIIIF
jgi:hypothetical protein